MKHKFTLVVVLVVMGPLIGCSSPSPQEKMRSHIQAEISFVRQTLPKVSYEMSEADADKIGMEVYEHRIAIRPDWDAPPEMVPALRQIRAAEQTLETAIGRYKEARKLKPGADYVKSTGDQRLGQVSGYVNSAEQMLQSKTENVNDVSSE